MINISQLVDSQLPDFFRQEYPVFVDFFKEYYKSQEVDGFFSNILRENPKLSRFGLLQRWSDP